MRSKIGGHDVGDGQRLLCILGPCVIESEESVQRHARRVKEVTAEFPINVVFKASFDKANRTSGSSFRGPGPAEGAQILSRVRASTGLPVLTDVHDVTQVQHVAPHVDVLQIPAFLCRQTDLIIEVAKHAKSMNVKKGQFVAPDDMKYAVQKARDAGAENIMLTERGSTFGYHDLVVDFRSFRTMREFAPVCFDATHSVQKPGGLGGKTGGDRTLAPVLARAAAAAGIDAIFAEVHEEPEKALSDGPNSLTFDLLHQLLREVTLVRAALGQR